MIPDRLSSAFQTAARGLAAQRERINVASRNIANVNTTSAEGTSGGYRPQSVQSSAPQSNNFQSELRNSMSSLRKTRENHMGPSSSIGSQNNSKGLGPEFKVTESNDFRHEYDPNHPHANDEGMVRYPDIDMVKEMTEIVSANRLYEANLSSVEAEKEIMKRSLQI